MKTYQKDQYGFLAKKGSNKYFGVNNTGPGNKYQYRIKLSKQFMKKLTGLETNSGFTTHTDDKSEFINSNELAAILKQFIETKATTDKYVVINGDFIITLDIKSETYGVVSKKLLTKKAIIELNDLSVTSTTSTTSNKSTENVSIVDDTLEQLKKINKKIDQLFKRLDKIEKKL